MEQFELILPNEEVPTHEGKTEVNPYLLPATIFLSSLIIAGALVYNARLRLSGENSQASIYSSQSAKISELEEKVLPRNGVALPVSWGNLGAKLVSVGAIDAKKFQAIYEKRENFTSEYKKLLTGNSIGKMRITEENAGFLLNLFWALGLASKNPILENGEMVDPAYGGAENFASTGGWTVSVGDPMDHYSKHKFFNLTPKQQSLVDMVSRGIYRPCCGNSTHFPDCNHGMAMLGLLELMASQGVSEIEMWKAALAVNSYWFPDTYLTIAAYFKERGKDWKDVDPKEILGAKYSSASGYRNIEAKVAGGESGRGNGGGCGVESEGEASAPAPRRQQGGCGI